MGQRSESPTEESPSTPWPVMLWPPGEPRPDIAPTPDMPKEVSTVPAICDDNNPVSPNDNNGNAEYFHQGYIVSNLLSFAESSSTGGGPSRTP